MKVCLLAPTPPPVGGIAGWTVRMMNAVLRNGWEVEVVDEKLIGKRTGFGGRTTPDIKDEMVRCFRIWSGLWKKVCDKEVKVVHACIPATTTAMIRETICALITKLHRKKFIIHFRCTVPNMVKSGLGRAVLKLLCGLSDRVMLLNEQSKAYISQLTKTPSVIIPNFIDETEFEESHVIREKIERVVYVGGVIEAKGVLDLLETAKAFPDIEFRLIGKADSQCAEAIAQVENAVLVGLLPRDEVRGELREADVFAFLSYFPGEGFSNALAEAMACGLPCLVSDWAANKDMIEDKGGCAVPIQEPLKAIEALKRMESASVRASQSQFNIRKAREQYCSQVVLEQYVECYENCLYDR